MIKEKIERIILDNISSLNPLTPTPEFGSDNLFECIEELQDYFLEEWSEDMKKEVRKEEPFSSELEVVEYYEKNKYKF